MSEIILMILNQLCEALQDDIMWENTERDVIMWKN